MGEDKEDDFFEVTPTSRLVWRRSVSSSEFMGIVSSDLYFQAGSCGLLTATRRPDTERILNSALSAYMDRIRELGREGIFESIVLVDAAFARDALHAALDAAIDCARQIISEKIDIADRFRSV